VANAVGKMWYNKIMPRQGTRISARLVPPTSLPGQGNQSCPVFGYVYITKNRVNGKMYVGQSVGKDRSYLGSGLIIKRAITKYGYKNFSVRIVAEVYSRIELDFMERWYIQKYRSRFPRKMYNVTAGGTGGPTNIGRRWSLATKRKMSAAAVGRILSTSTKEKIGRASKGRVIPEETRRRMSLVQRGLRISARSKDRMYRMKLSPWRYDHAPNALRGTARGTQSPRS